MVTGMGAVTPLGCDMHTSWTHLCAGQSGIRPIGCFDTKDFPVRIAGEVPDFDPEQWLSRQQQRRTAAFIWYGMAAGIQAFESSGLKISAANRDRIGILIGSGIGGLGLIEDNHTTLIDKGPRRVSPFLVPGAIINMVGGNLAERLGTRGPNIATATACTSGTHAIATAARLIQAGDCDAALAGGAEKPVTPLGVASFAAMRALSTCNEQPTLASRPWDRERDGFVLGDGAGVLMLEEYSFAEARGATILAELAGVGLSADAHHATAPAEDGAGAALAMRMALTDAGVKPEEIDYINAHGTSTQLGDLAETLAIKNVFGTHAKTLAVSSNKSMIGHLLGAAGGAEAVFTVMSLRDQRVPPTINLSAPGEGCDLDYVPGEARDLRLRAVMSNSFGFGGTNGCLLFRRID